MSSVLKVDNIENIMGVKRILQKRSIVSVFEVEEGEYIGIIGGFRKWEDDIIKLYFNDRSGDCGKYYDQWNGYHKIERKTSFKIQTRGIRIYLPRL